MLFIFHDPKNITLRYQNDTLKLVVYFSGAITRMNVFLVYYDISDMMIRINMLCLSTHVIFQDEHQPNMSSSAIRLLPKPAIFDGRELCVALSTVMLS